MLSLGEVVSNWPRIPGDVNRLANATRVMLGVLDFSGQLTSETMTQIIREAIEETIRRMSELTIIYEGVFPTKSYEDDAGFDLVAYSLAGGADDKSLLGTVFVGGTLKLMCGFKMALPSGWFADIRPRSGLSTKRRLVPANTPGTIDAGYRDEISVVLMNLGSEKQEIYRGDRIAQMVILPVPKVNLVNGKLNESSRGVKGYGSSG